MFFVSPPPHTHTESGDVEEVNFFLHFESGKGQRERERDVGNEVYVESLLTLMLCELE